MRRGRLLRRCDGRRMPRHHGDRLRSHAPQAVGRQHGRAGRVRDHRPRRRRLARGAARSARPPEPSVHPAATALRNDSAEYRSALHTHCVSAIADAATPPPPPSRRETLVATLASRPTISVISVLETAIPRSARRATPVCLASRPVCTYTLSPTPIAVSPPPPGGAGAQPLARPQGVESRSGIAGPASG